MDSPLQPSLSSTLGELPLCGCWVKSTDPGEHVEQLFEQQPDLPGVIVLEDSRIVGVISRRRFFRSLSKGFGQEIFLRRPIKIFIEQMQKVSFLRLSSRDSVQRAMQMALSRPADDKHEPIVVIMDESMPSGEPNCFLLAFDVLLLAQTEILAVVNCEIQEQALKLEEERQKVNQYAHLLEQQQAVIRERNQQLEKNQAELLERSEEIANLNQRFFQIGQLLSVEGAKAFRATFKSANAICLNTGVIVTNGQLLNQELDTVRGISNMIEKVSQQVRHLAIQAAIVANHDGARMSGFSYITEEIRKLGTQTFEAGRQMDLIASRLESRIEELTNSAQTCTTVARSLVGEIESARAALAELEQLVEIESAKDVATGVSGEAQAFVQRIEVLEDTLSELKELMKNKDSKYLVQKIKSVLDTNKTKPIMGS
ncbi:chemotaxis protein [Oscillatoria sp. FACHB-1407]|uniref:chemotaxis protein n=1 Tax=Oscillatoria sp. FACHB-1407 TaxID=2692847 RepID=UPI00168344D6|nr:chemotaxis protein [Oscillatoria sp. FACHB-1407]MBD2460275.1 chemotaxis protein [Oscillatoria sp. FACHB-1407]